LAAHLLEPEEYFEVLKRYQLLRVLPLSPGFSEPVGLEALLTEAGVINELRGHANGTELTGPEHQDTLD
jgi:hypothetical protein